MRRPSSSVVLIALLLAAFNLRTGIAEIGPLIDDIRAETGMSHAVVGVLTTIPFVCIAIFSFAGPGLFSRRGSGSVIVIALISILLGTLARAIAPTAFVMIIATIPIGVGIALIGVTLPVLVKQHFPSRAGAVTGAYVASLSIGLAIVAATMVPLADLLGGWREALAVTAIAPLAALIVWLALRDRPADSQPDRETPSLDRRPGRTGILLALCLGFEAACFAGVLAWVVSVYEDAGWSDSDAAWTLAVLGLLNVPGAILIGPLSDGRDRRPWVAATVSLMAIGVLGIGLAPTALAAGWLLIFSAGSGSSFALLLSLPLDLGSNPARVSVLSSWMLGLGFAISAISPFVVGLIRDVTGSFDLPMSLLALTAIGSAACALLLPRARLSPSPASD